MKCVCRDRLRVRRVGLLRRMALKKMGTVNFTLSIRIPRLADWNDSSKGAVDSLESTATQYFCHRRLGSDCHLALLLPEAARTWTLPIDLIFIDGDHSYEG